MKRLWIAVGILLAITALGIGALFWQISAVMRLSHQLDALETAVTNRESDMADRAYRFLDTCISTMELLECITHHADNLPLEETVAKMPALLENGEYARFYEAAAQCRVYLHELEKSEKPIPGNIF